MAEGEKTRAGATRETAVLVGVALALIMAGFFVATRFVEAPPPRSISIAAASKGSPYYRLAERYQSFMAKNGVTLDIRETSGSAENLRLLNDPSAGVGVGFLQGGIANGQTAPALRSLGRVMYEPLWVFVGIDSKIERLADLKGKRVLVGPAGGGTNSLALRILEANDVTASSATLVNMELPDYIAELDSGRADAGFLVLGASARTVQALFKSPRVRLLNLTQAEAYAERLPFLSALTLKQGIVDFAANLPPTDTAIVATRAAIVVRADLHPAIANLMTQALIAAQADPMLDSKGEAPIFSGAAMFPMQTDPEFALSDQARRVYRSGPPLLQRYLPFGIATMIDRLIVLAVPLIGILVPVVRFAPKLYTWRIRRRLLLWYRKLKKLEHSIPPNVTQAQLAEKLDEVEAIEDAVNRIPIPIGFTNQLYDLRQHIDVVRRRLSTVRARA